MTQDEIIDMARQVSNTPVDATSTPDLFGVNQIVKFAKLVAQHEREQNAKICQELAKDMTLVAEFAAKLCAKSIEEQA